MKLRAVPLTDPPTDSVEDWQAESVAPRYSPPAGGEEGEGPHDGYANRHVILQLLGWGANVDSSFIVDSGAAYRYIVKYASKGEPRSREVQRMLTDMINAAAESDPADGETRTVRDMLRFAMMTCTTRRDMGVQEVMHLLSQIRSGRHDLHFKQACNRKKTVELRRTSDGGRQLGLDLLDAYSDRSTPDVWFPADTLPAHAVMVPMSYGDFASKFDVGRD